MVYFNSPPPRPETVQKWRHKQASDAFKAAQIRLRGLDDTASDELVSSKRRLADQWQVVAEKPVDPGCKRDCVKTCNPHQDGVSITDCPINQFYYRSQFEDVTAEAS